MAEYKLRTMKQDIEELRKKQKGFTEPTATPKKEEPLPTFKPGIPLPSEPLATAERPKLVKKPPEKKAPQPTPGIKKEKEKPRKTALIPIILLVIALLIAGGIYYWWNYLRGVEKPEPEMPRSLIRIEQTNVISIKEGQEVDLFQTLKTAAQKTQALGTLQRILIKKITSQEDYFLSFVEIAQILALNIPADISKSLGDDHTLFVYTEEEGNRLGVIIEIKDPVVLRDYLRFWEQAIHSDLQPFFLGEELGEAATEVFQDNIFSPTGEAAENVRIRYCNFPDPHLTIDYAMVNNHLIITTSRATMYEAIDRVLEK